MEVGIGVGKKTIHSQSGFIQVLQVHQVQFTFMSNCSRSHLSLQIPTPFLCSVLRDNKHNSTVGERKKNKGWGQGRDCKKSLGWAARRGSKKE